ncbi:MAG: host attachment protein, partial [Sphingomonadaceae bacterium]
MHLPHNSSVLVADGRKYLIFRNHGDAHRLDLRFQTQGEQPNLKNHELHSDAPGTQTQRWGHARPAMEETDFH